MKSIQNNVTKNLNTIILDADIAKIFQSFNKLCDE